MFTMRTIVLGVSAAAVAVLGIGVAGSHADPLLQPATTCGSSSACVTTTNTSSGPATAAISDAGPGSKSTTDFNSTSATNFKPGILGIDASTKGTFDVGVEGTSVRGTGVSGISTKGTGVSGASTSGTGLSGSSTNGTGVAGSGGAVGVEGSSNGTGVEAIANAGGTDGTGLLAYANGTGGVGVSGNGASIGVQGVGGSVAVQAVGSGGTLFSGVTNGIQEFSVAEDGYLTTNNIDVSNQIVGQQADFNTSGPLVALYGEVDDATSPNAVIEAVGQGANLIQGYGSGGLVFSLDNAGDVSIAGLLYTEGDCNSGCVKRGPDQRRVVSYAPRESQPTMEDMGEAQLVNGEARVALDPSFANVIDRDAEYLVFVTPEGDCNGLFIAAKSSTGFTVRELRGGRSSLEFEYRIVAKPFGDASPRLPMMTMPHLVKPALFRPTPSRVTH
jgi:hypothetical protein